MVIRAARAEEMHQVRELFLEYAQSLGFSLCFQGFQQELDELPGRYGPPDGVLLLAWENDEPVGVVGLRRLDAVSVEMKRLYVRPDQRGKKIGKQLAMEVISEAKRLGYTSIKLDTVPAMAEARQMYINLGFEQIPAYYQNSEIDSICLEKRITPG